MVHVDIPFGRVILGSYGNMKGCYILWNHHRVPFPILPNECIFHGPAKMTAFEK